MKVEDILAIKPVILKQAEREFYFENGYLLLEKAINDEWLEKLRATVDELVEETRPLTRSDKKWDLEPNHSHDDPRLRRLSSPNDHHQTFWDYASGLPMVDIVADLVGPDVKFHHSKLNFKWAKGGEEVKWHQDIQFWPHTNYTPLTVGTYLYDCDDTQGPLGIIPGSHAGELYNQYDASGKWTGCLSDTDSASLDAGKAVYLPGPAGSLTIHNCRTIHGSKPNRSNAGRPLLLNVYSAADAIPYTHNPLYSKYDQAIVRGERARWADHDPRPCLMPPDWGGNYSSIFALQQGEQAGMM
ncbi:MAG: phytanoyl-CoA dioxygenase family protein [Rhodospirillales bacterium]